MKTFLTIWYQPLKTYKYLESKLENEIETRTSFLFLILGLMSGLNSFFIDDWLSKGILISILLLVLSSGFGIILGRFIFSYPILWMSRLFKGKATIDNVRMCAAYSFIPYFIATPWILYLGIEKANLAGNTSVFWITFFINNILWLYAMILLVIGLKHYNNYGYLKAILTISPLIIIAIIAKIIIY